MDKDDWKKNYVLVGIYLRHGYEEEEELATFNKEKDALAYIENAKLKKPYYHHANSFLDKIFRKNSLLCHFKEAYIREYYEPTLLPHNPKIKT